MSHESPAKCHETHTALSLVCCCVPIDVYHGVPQSDLGWLTKNVKCSSLTYRTKRVYKDILDKTAHPLNLQSSKTPCGVTTIRYSLSKAIFTLSHSLVHMLLPAVGRCNRRCRRLRLQTYLRCFLLLGIDVYEGGSFAHNALLPQWGIESNY